MKLLERYGSPILSYEGSCQVVFSENDYRIDYSGYFEAAQYTSGRLVIGIVPTIPPQISSVENQDSHDPKLTFAGMSTDGWEIKTIEDSTFNRIAWSFSPMLVQPVDLLIGPRRFETSYRNRSEGFHYSVRFLVSNFIWHDNEERGPEPIEVSVNGFRIIINPVEYYRDVANELIGGAGVRPTALIDVESISGQPQQLDDFVELLDDLLCVLRLVTGNQVSWYYGESQDFVDRPAARIHNHSHPLPYSNTVRFRYVDKIAVSLIPKLDVAGLLTSYFDETDRILDNTTIESLVNQLTNAASTTSFLESAGLIASSLTELIASKYAEVRKKSEKIQEGVYEDLVLPRLKSAVNDTALHDDLQEHICNYLKGGFRYSFRSKLKLMRDELNLPLNSRDINQLVNTRNELVHRGEYSSVAEGLNWLREYNFIVWTDIMILCRLMGYEGNFTVQVSPERIEI